jgi:hypothetical protein
VFTAGPVPSDRTFRPSVNRPNGYQSSQAIAGNQRTDWSVSLPILWLLSISLQKNRISLAIATLAAIRAIIVIVLICNPLELCAFQRLSDVRRKATQFF